MIIWLKMHTSFNDDILTVVNLEVWCLLDVISIEWNDIWDT